MRIILGLDPGSQYTGYGILSSNQDRMEYLSHGVLELGGRKAFAARLHELFCQLNRVMEEWRPTDVVVEKVFLGPNVDSAFKLGHARGVCLSLSAQYECQLHELAPRAVKKAVTGYGAASKDQVALAVSSWLRMETKGVRHDATDALALAVARALVAESETRIKQMMMENP
ncbi:MAG: crossover junction endodeoxyribonuclease RuvC [Bdellovibrionales bacterium]|nr:crossover junction endodeoxyribonuclease RuvC [Bdellovibrionales bacterium]